ncbi:hypothetical protein HELRODRAFT_62606, partial [Helobdella robusta]|uniref:B30.2/SPRY domain-containing protein n=1 Tax=Helobdella robusta TaxID=6412 RepID=T1FX27_HELRO
DMGQKISGSPKTVFINPTSFFSNNLSRPARLDVLLERPHADFDVQVRHAWNPLDKSTNLFIKDDDMLTVHRHPVAQSTDCIRGKVGYTRGIHVWEIYWNARHRGTHAVIGVATGDAVLQAPGYSSLVGNDEKSWGWDLSRNRLCYNEQSRRNGNVSEFNKIYPQFPGFVEGDIVVVPDKFLVILDMDEGTLSFMASNVYLGVAFTGLKGLILYPVVNAVWGHCEISMKYIGGMEMEPLSLQCLSRQAIRWSLRDCISLEHVNNLPLPKKMIDYIKCTSQQAS